MRKNIWFLYIFVLLASFTFIQLNCAPDDSEKELSQAEMVQRGEYLVNFGSCHDCHTPKKGFDENGPIMDNDRLLSGHPANEALTNIDTSAGWVHSNMTLTAWTGPWGVSYAANLTPDGPTGLGNWTEEIFIKAMRTGKHMGAGRPILPPMPWFSVKHLNDQDLKSVFAYLKSINAVSNRVPDPVPPDMIAQLNNNKK